jgi:hypothetical protein
VENDHLVLSIPVGSAPTDLEADGSQVDCSTPANEWVCTVAISIEPSQVEITLGPLMNTVVVPASGTVCFDITGVQVNSQPGLAFSNLDQFVDKKRADKLTRKPLDVLGRRFCGR